MRKYFGTDGVRGKVGEFPMQFDFLVKLGYVVGKRFRKLLIVRDTRESGPEIQDYIAWGAMEAGAEVVSGGILPTSSLALLVGKLGFDAGLSISASHNVYSENGVKILSRKGVKLSDELEEKIERELDSLRYIKIHRRSYQQRNLASLYVEELLKKAGLEGDGLGGMKIAIDAGHGAAYLVAEMLFSRAGAEVEMTGNRPNGVNINESGAVKPEAIASFVKEAGAEVGFSYDGDADRCIWADERGRVLDGDYTLLLMASHLSEKGRLRNNKVVATVMSNFALDRTLSQRGIEVVRAPVGDRYVYETMRREGAVLGGEQSGHTIFMEYLPTGDGLLTALLISKTLKERGEKASYWREQMVPFPQIKKNFPVRKKIPLEKLPELQRTLRKIKEEMGDRIYLVVRYSGTEPVLRVSLQGEKKEWLEQCMEEIERAVKNIKELYQEV